MLRDRLNKALRLLATHHSVPRYRELEDMSWNQQGRWSQKTQNSWKGNWQNAKSKPVEKPTNKSEGFPTYDGAKVDLDAFPTFTPVSLSQPALASSASDGDLKAILKTYMQQNPGKLPKELTELVKPKVVTGSRQAMQKQLNLVKKLDTKLQKKTDHLENKKASWITWKQTLKAFYAAEFERYEKDVKGLQEEIDKLQLERNAEQKKLDEGTFQDVADAGMKDQLSDMEDDLFGPEEPTQVPPKVMDGMAHILNGALMEHLSAEIQNGIAKHFQTMAMSPQMPHRTSGLSERFSEEVKESEPGQPAAGNGETMILELDKVLHFEQDLKQQLQSASQSVLEMFKEAIVEDMKRYQGHQDRMKELLEDLKSQEEHQKSKILPRRSALQPFGAMPMRQRSRSRTSPYGDRGGKSAATAMGGQPANMNAHLKNGIDQID